MKHLVFVFPFLFHPSVASECRIPPNINISSLGVPELLAGEKICRTNLSIDPNSLIVWANFLEMLYRKTTDLSEQTRILNNLESIYRIGISVHSHDKNSIAVFLNNLGSNLVFRQNRARDGRTLLLQAYPNNPNNIVLVQNVYRSYIRDNLLKEAVVFSEDAVRKHPALATPSFMTEMATTFPSFFESEKDIEFWRRRFHQYLTKIISFTTSPLYDSSVELKGLNIFDEFFFDNSPGFYLLAYTGRRELGLIRLLHQNYIFLIKDLLYISPHLELRKDLLSSLPSLSSPLLSSPFLSSPLQSLSSLSLPVRRLFQYKSSVEREDRGGKISVGFFSSFFRYHASARMIAGIIPYLNSEKFHVTLLFAHNPTSPPMSPDAMEALFRRKANKCIDIVFSEISQVRREIEDQKFDILVFGELGMDKNTWLLAHSRLAPVQLVTHGHASTSGIGLPLTPELLQFFSQYAQMALSRGKKMSVEGGKGGEERREDRERSGEEKRREEEESRKDEEREERRGERIVSRKKCILKRKGRCYSSREVGYVIAERFLSKNNPFDGYLSYRVFEKEDQAANNYVETLLSLDGFVRYPRPNMEGVEISRTKKLENFFPNLKDILKEKKIIFTILQTPFKFYPAFDKALHQILLRAGPTSVLLIKKSTELSLQWVNRIKKVTGEDFFEKHIKFLPDGIPHDAWWNLLDQTTVVLDTFPFGGYTTTLEALYIGQAVVSLEHPSSMAGRCSAAFLRRLGVERETVAQNVDEFVEKAFALATDATLRANTRETIARNAVERLFDGDENWTAVKEWENLMLAWQSGRDLTAIKKSWVQGGRRLRTIPSFSQSLSYYTDTDFLSNPNLVGRRHPLKSIPCYALVKLFHKYHNSNTWLSFP